VSPRTAQRLRTIGEALRDLAGGVLLASGFIALLWLAELVTMR
jgi:hypothetical protein